MKLIFSLYIVNIVKCGFRNMHFRMTIFWWNQKISISFLLFDHSLVIFGYDMFKFQYWSLYISDTWISKVILKSKCSSFYKKEVGCFNPKCSFSSLRFQSKAQARAHRLILIIDGRDRCVLPTVMNAKIKSEWKVEAARFKVAARFELAANPRIRTSKLAVDALFQCWQGSQLFPLM